MFFRIATINVGTAAAHSYIPSNAEKNYNSEKNAHVLFFKFNLILQIVIKIIYYEHVKFKFCFERYRCCKQMQKYVLSPGHTFYGTILKSK